MALRFLVADDNSAHQCLMASVVMTLGGQAARVSSGMEVLKRAAREEFDMIILELGMPELGGVETASKLLEEFKDRNRRPRMLAVTGGTSPGQRALCRAVGMDGLISKPYDIPALKHILLEVMLYGHCWPEGPSVRQLDLAKFLQAISRGDPAQLAEFERGASKSMEQLQKLAPGAKGAVLEVEEIGAFASTYGFLRLKQAMDEFVKANGKAEGAAFASRLMAERGAFQSVLATVMDSIPEAKGDLITVKEEESAPPTLVAAGGPHSD